MDVGSTFNTAEFDEVKTRNNKMFRFQIVVYIFVECEYSSKASG